MYLHKLLYVVYFIALFSVTFLVTPYWANSVVADAQTKLVKSAVCDSAYRQGYSDGNAAAKRFLNKPLVNPAPEVKTEPPTGWFNGPQH